jgi:hypothetical protein
VNAVILFAPAFAAKALAAAGALAGAVRVALRRGR